MPERRIFVPFYNNIFPLIFMLLTDTKKLEWQSIKFYVINRRWCYIIWCISIKSNRPTGYLQILMHEYLYTFQLFDIKRKYLFKMMTFDKQLNNILSTEFVILNVCWWRNLVYHICWMRNIVVLPCSAPSGLQFQPGSDQNRPKREPKQELWLIYFRYVIRGL